MAVDLFSMLCRRRGWSDDFLQAINAHDHPELKDVDRCCELIHQVATAGTAIVVLPDFDMDGITSGLVLFIGLAELGLNVRLYRPHPERGYGFGGRDIAEIAEQYPETGAIITCDVGIDAHRGIAAAKKRGWLVLVTDHHLQAEQIDTAGELTADVLVDPMRSDETYPHPQICGAHVAWQVLDRYARRYAPSKVEAINRLRLFAGVGTISDMMPLKWENRQLVKDSVSLSRLCWVDLPTTTNDYGEKVPDLEAWPDPTQSTMYQLLAAEGGHAPAYTQAFLNHTMVLAAFARLGKLRNIDDIDSEFYGFYLAPTYNSLKRMDGDMTHAFGSWLVSDPRPHIEAVVETNERRKELVEFHTTEIERMTELGRQPFAPYVYLTRCPGGIAGLVATRLMGASGVPTLVLGVPDPDDTDQTLRGSGRSPAWYPANEELNAIGAWARGHSVAFGVHVRDAELLVKVHEHLSTDVPRRRAELLASGELSEQAPCDLRLGSTPDCDASLDATGAVWDLSRALAELEPFGMDFTRPVIELVVDLSRCEIATIGKKGMDHIAITLFSGVKLNWWNSTQQVVGTQRYERMAEDFALDPGPMRIDWREVTGNDSPMVRVRGCFEVNSFLGVESLQFGVDQIEPYVPGPALEAA